MKKIRIYLKHSCPYCMAAMKLFDSKEIAYEVLDVNLIDGGFEGLKKKTGMQTVPQIFIEDELIGGYSELKELEDKGKLNELIS